MTKRYVAAVLCLLTAAGCSSATQIQTAPPRPATVPEGTTSAEGRAPFTVTLGRGPTALPEGVQSLRLRVAEVRLRRTDGTWIAYPADANHFTVGRGPALQKTVLSTYVPLATFDSLGLTFSDVYVEYDANAGGPLTLPRDEPLRMALDLRPRADRRSTLRLTFEPGASLSRDRACQWYFLPFVTATVE